MMRMIQGYKPTSKASLKQFCLLATKADVKQASELYDFMIKDIEDLPTFDPVPPTWVDNTKQVVGDIFGFIKENKDGLAQGYDIIRTIITSKGKVLPDIGATPTPVEPLPPIN